MSDTPETDAECINQGWGPSCPCKYLHADFARKLERDRDEWKSVAEGRLLGAISERDSLLAAIERIDELAGDDECIFATMDAIRAIADNALNHHYSEQEGS